MHTFCERFSSMGPHLLDEIVNIHFQNLIIFVHVSKGRYYLTVGQYFNNLIFYHHVSTNRAFRMSIFNACVEDRTSRYLSVLY